MPPTTRFPSPPLDLNPVPRPCVLLLLQTPLSHFQPRRAVLCQTELRPFSRWARDRAHPYRAGRAVTPLRSATPSPPARHGTPGPSRSRHSTPGPSRERASTPGPSQPRSVRFPDEPSPSDEGSGNDDDHEITELRAPDADGFIPKPFGEVGRRERGYSLQTILGWDDSIYKRLKKQVNVDISNYLDHTLSESNQPAGLVKNLTKVIAAKHPIVSRFRDAWPIADMIHLRLKYTSGRSRRGLPKTPQGEDYPKDISEALKALERGKAVEHHPEPEVAREVERGTRTPRAVRVREESGGRNGGPSPILMGVNKRAGGKQALGRVEAREEEQNSDSEDDD
ncbi:hypothetical protein GSI_07525 [Ganoderma sinense ZZ0214-1]|uniref:Uncharacterized protein n=1 Tax=Ganoderma sinense ZZ0214-1 TaxID=1077348 RepID=A0A2G8S9A4_9APHY|nr:hypothetical protein GSI_07525 [Ganoderma sinense ZZ0214-1]